MAKDKKARAENHVTVMALANMLAAIVDAMRDGGVPNDIIHGFLDRLTVLNSVSLSGMPAAIIGDFVDVIRGTVADND
jgi:hypothetical protein